MVSKLLSETYELQPPDVQRLALVEEHESARIIKIISKTKIGEVGHWEENTTKQLTAEPTQGYRWCQLNRTQPSPAPEKMLSSNTHTLKRTRTRLACMRGATRNIVASCSLHMASLLLPKRMTMMRGSSLRMVSSTAIEVFSCVTA